MQVAVHFQWLLLPLLLLLLEIRTRRAFSSILLHISVH